MTQSLTVVIPTYNRGTQLVEVLNHVLQNDVAGFDLIELLIIDDSSAIPAESFIDRSIIKHPFTLQFIIQKNAGPAAARNNGLARAKGEVVLFIDDDVLVEKRTLREHYDAHKIFPGSVMYGNYPYIIPARITPAYSYMKKLLDDGLQRIIEVHPNQDFVRVEGVASGNLSVPKNIFSEHNSLYDTSLSIPAAEEYDLMFSLLKRGIPVYFGLHTMKAWHLQPVTIKDKCIQEFKYGMGIAEVCIKKPSVLEYAPVRFMFETNGPLLPSDSMSIKLKKSIKSVIVAGPSRSFLKGLTTICEVVLPFNFILFPLYRLATGLSLMAGIKKGRIIFNSPQA